MAHHWSEGVSSLRFTAREFQLELIEEALKHNLLTCPPVTTGFFVTLKLIQELAYQIRSPSTKKTVILVPLYQVKALAVQLCHLTDLQTIGLLNCDLSDKKLNIYEIIVCTSEVLDNVLTKSIISISNINLLVIEQCHMIVKDAHLQNIMSYYLKENSNLSLSSMSPKILAFTYPLFTPHDNENPEKTVKQAKELLHEYRKEPPSNHAAIFSSEDEMQSSEPYVELECLKGFSQFGNSDEDPESMEMNSFRFWHTPLEDIVIDEVPEAEPEEVAIEEICEEVIVEKKNPERSIYDMVEYRLEHLERVLSCKTDLAADIVGLKRITGKPKEIILECESILEDDHCEDRVRLEKYMKSVIAGALVFLSDHRYDPTEIYGCETYDEELKAIPNPCTEPRQMLELFLYVLDEMGAYAADKAAFILLIKLEKLKIKIPYERHFLLLCLVSSAFIQIRAAAEMIFENYTTDKDKISTFSTLKVLRLLDILKLFKPKEVDNKSSKYSGSKVDDHQRENTHSKHASNDSYKADSGNLNLSNDCSETLIKDTLTTSVKDNKIESSNSKIEEIVIKNDDKKNILEHCECMKKVCDKCNKIRDNQKVQKTESDSLECKEISVNQSTSVSDKLQSSVEHVDGSDLKDHKVNVEKNCDSASTLDSDKKIKTDPIKVVIKDSPMKRNDGNYRGRGRGRGGKGYNFHRYGSNIDPDALCGLIFVDEPLVAKILATMINEFCRYDENLKFICAQYTVDKVADPLTDTREAESEHKLQEEVLKRFRVHECNLLVGTEYLEEGLDLPKCNLVIKWDIPSGYVWFGYRCF